MDDLSTIWRIRKKPRAERPGLFRCQTSISFFNKGLIMRSLEGQRSDNRPLKRNDDEKRRALLQLEAAYAALGPKPTPGLKETMAERIRALKAEIAEGAAKPPRRERDRDRG
jgi:hypothetical protein